MSDANHATAGTAHVEFTMECAEGHAIARARSWELETATGYVAAEGLGAIQVRAALEAAGARWHERPFDHELPD